MGAFKIEIVGVGGHGCERKSKPGEKLYGRCGRFSCPDCAAFDFTQRLRQAGMLHGDSTAYSVEVPADDPAARAYLAGYNRESAPAGSQPEYFERDGKVYRQIKQSATFTHWPDQPGTVVDDMLANERKSGSF